MTPISLLKHATHSGEVFLRLVGHGEHGFLGKGSASR